MISTFPTSVAVGIEEPYRGAFRIEHSTLTMRSGSARMMDDVVEEQVSIGKHPALGPRG